MVEIKRTRPGQSVLNQKIGVVNTRTGKQDIYKAQAESFFSLSQSGLKIAAQLGQEKAREYALGAPLDARDENGTLIPAKMPEDVWVGRAGRADAKEILDKRYMLKSQIDIDDFAQRALIKNPQNPGQVKADITNYIYQTQKVLEDQGDVILANEFGEMGYKTASQYTLKAEQNKATLESKLDLDNVINVQAKMVNDLSMRVANGDTTVAEASSIIDGMAKDSMAFYGQTVAGSNDFRRRFKLAAFEKSVTANFVNLSESQVDRVIIDLMALDPKSPIAKAKPELFKLYQDMDQQTRGAAESHMSSVRVKLINDRKEEKALLEISRKISGGTATSAELDTFLRANGLSGDNRYATPENREEVVGYLKQAGSLDTQLISDVRFILSGNSLNTREAPNKDIQVLQFAFAALRNDTSFRGRPQFNSRMGLEIEEVSKLQNLQNAFDQGPERFGSTLNRIQNTQASYDLISTIVGSEYAGKDTDTIAAKILAHSSFDEMSAEAKRDMKNVLLDSIILTGSAREGIEKTRKEFKKYYTESNYSEGLTRDAPEERFPELAQDKDHRHNFWSWALDSFKGDRNKRGQFYVSEQEAQEFAPRNPFNNYVDNVLSYSTNPSLTVDDVWLDTEVGLTDKERVVYTLRERKTNNPVMFGNGSQVKIDSNHFQNLLRVEALRDKEFESRLAFGAEEAEAIAYSMAGYIGQRPGNTILGMISKQVDRIRQTRRRDDELLFASPEYLQGKVLDFFDRPDGVDNRYIDSDASFNLNRKAREALLAGPFGKGK